MFQKKESKENKKREKKIKSTLEWMDIQSISGSGIVLKRGNTEKIVRGIKVEPVNVYLLTEHERNSRFFALANAIDKLKINQYFRFPKTSPDMNQFIDHYLKLYSRETNKAKRKLIQMQLDKMDWFSSTFKEVTFYILIQEDEERIDKNMDMLIREYLLAGFNLSPMTVTDYESIVSQEFENETVNEYLFTHILLPEGGD